MNGFTITNCGLFDSHALKLTDGMTTVRHVREYEIELYTYVTDGCSIVNGISYPHKPGNILIARPGDVRQSRIGHFRAYDIHFKCTDTLLTGKYLDGFPTLLYCSDLKRLLSIFTEIIFAADSSIPGQDIYCIGKIYELVSAINDISLLGRHPDASRCQHLKNVSRSMEYMKENYMKSLPLEEAAAVAHLSPSYFHSVFKDIVGMTPCGYLTQLRVREAQKMLINSKKSLCEIALDSGFSSQAYFCSVFRRLTGVTPQKYRAQKFMPEESGH